MSELAKVQTYGRITKVNAKDQTVEGIGADETPDSDNEVFDYETSKPYIEAWSNKQAETTKSAGQEVSYGNIRGQHDAKVAAGRVADPIEFNDTSKSVFLTTKIVDKDEFQKCLEGVYTGFSVKGRSVKKWRDGRHVRYTVDPIEFSLVDVPCNPGATFTAVKADGSSEEREFQKTKAQTVLRSADDVLIEIDGVRRFHDEHLEKFVERAVSTLVSKAAATQPKTETKEKSMKTEVVEKVAASEKMKAARKAHNDVGACLGGYCDHNDASKCLEKAADASKHVTAAFTDDDADAEKSAKVTETKVEEKVETKTEVKKADEEKTEKAAGSEIADLKADVAKLTELVTKMAEQPGSQRNKPVVNGAVVTKEGDVTKAADSKKAADIDPNDPDRVEKSLKQIHAGELELVKL